MRKLGIATAALLVVGALFGLTYVRPYDDDPDAPPPAPEEQPPVPLARPSAPPVPGRDEPFSLPDPAPPDDMDAKKAAAYGEARAKGDPHPAEVAFRASVQRFVEHNRRFAEEQARAEGITVAEVEELTHFGFLAQQTQRWPDVEDVLGKELDPAVKEYAERLLADTNVRFKERMRTLVRERAPEAARWELIRRTQDEYRRAYYELTGMNDARLQDLLAGDLAKKYPPSQQPTPEELAQPPPEPERDEPRPQNTPEP